MSPKQRLQSKPPLLQKSVLVVPGPFDDVVLSASGVEGVVGLGAAESKEGVELPESDPDDDEQVSSPCCLSPGK